MYGEWWLDGPAYRKTIPDWIYRSEVILRRNPMKRGVEDVPFHKNRDVSATRDGSAYECDLFWCEGDYIVLQPRLGADSPMAVYHGTREDLVLVAASLGQGGLYDKALEHQSPEAYRRLLDKREAERRQQWLASRRDGLDTLVATLPTKSYFVLPTGEVGYVAGLGRSTSRGAGSKMYPRGARRS